MSRTNDETARIGAGGEDHCIWYGVCNVENTIKQYCPVNHTAKEFPQDKLDMFKANCPHLVRDHMKDGKLNLCCNPQMVSDGITDSSLA